MHLNTSNKIQIEETMEESKRENKPILLALQDLTKEKDVIMGCNGKCDGLNYLGHKCPKCGSYCFLKLKKN